MVITNFESSETVVKNAYHYPSSKEELIFFKCLNKFLLIITKNILDSCSFEIKKRLSRLIGTRLETDIQIDQMFEWRF